MRTHTGCKICGDPLPPRTPRAVKRQEYCSELCRSIGRTVNTIRYKERIGTEHDEQPVPSELVANPYRDWMTALHETVAREQMHLYAAAQVYKQACVETAVVARAAEKAGVPREVIARCLGIRLHMLAHRIRLVVVA